MPAISHIVPLPTVVPTPSPDSNPRAMSQNGQITVQALVAAKICTDPVPTPRGPQFLAIQTMELEAALKTRGVSEKQRAGPIRMLWAAQDITRKSYGTPLAMLAADFGNAERIG